MTTTENTWLNEAHTLLETARRWYEGEIPSVPHTTAGWYLQEAAFDFFAAHRNCRQSESLLADLAESFAHAVPVLETAVALGEAVASHSVAALDCWHAFRAAVDRFNAAECGILQAQQLWRERN
jgi:hypothetical protein